MLSAVLLSLHDSQLSVSCILDRRSVHLQGWSIGSLHVRPLPAFVDPQLLDLPGRLLGTRDGRP